MQCIHSLAIHSPESNESSRWGLMDLVHMAACSIHWATLWSTESIKISRWSLMDLVHMAACSIHWATLWSTESIKSSRWSLMDLVHMAACSIRWAILWSTESNKSSRWGLMDLVYMAACSIRWAIHVYSTESIKIKQNLGVDFDGCYGFNKSSGDCMKFCTWLVIFCIFAWAQLVKQWNVICEFDVQIWSSKMSSKMSDARNTNFVLFLEHFRAHSGRKSHRIQHPPVSFLCMKLHVDILNFPDIVLVQDMT